jgi:DeoR/GlpR family transcriptional regulator of sugar metabolism
LISSYSHTTLVSTGLVQIHHQYEQTGRFFRRIPVDNAHNSDYIDQKQLSILVCTQGGTMAHPAQRRQRILAEIGQYDHDDDLIPRLSQMYGVSEVTIRRDLKYLEEQGVIKRTYGGAIRLPSSAGELMVIAREQRQNLFSRQKERIARYAARELVRDHDIILLGGGTTVTAMVPFLADRQQLTVVTNGLHTAYELQRLPAPNMTVICMGGILRPVSSTFIGPVTERCLQDIHANKLFVSATGITLEAGVTDPNMHETQVKRAMVNASSQVILLMDSSKFGTKSLMKVLDITDIDILITDDGCPHDVVDQIRAKGVDVNVVPDSTPAMGS